MRSVKHTALVQAISDSSSSLSGRPSLRCPLQRTPEFLPLSYLVRLTRSCLGLYEKGWVKTSLVGVK